MSVIKTYCLYCGSKITVDKQYGMALCPECEAPLIYDDRREFLRNEYTKAQEELENYQQKSRESAFMFVLAGLAVLTAIAAFVFLGDAFAVLRWMCIAAAVLAVICGFIGTRIMKDLHDTSEEKLKQRIEFIQDECEKWDVEFPEDGGKYHAAC